ncbi:MAG: hypothetical protein K2O14_05950, partial [Oscillospiraceae bacterium]|nr:hypothetical protein [Oscillospiraceae bacterium]
CKTPFEKLVFTRLCEFRYNKAINECLNLVRVQDYAKNKVSFIFSKNLKSAEDAAARRNYFDLIFSVTAKELGCRIEDMAETKVFSIGRVPTAPYMFPNISKNIVKNVLADFDYSDDYSNSNGYGELSDQIAMDAFLHMKAGLEGEFDSYNITDSKMEKNLEKVYMPLGLKAAVDLEIDALIEHGGWLARCKRCGRFFLRDAEHKEDFCSLTNPGGKTCLEIYEIENPKPKFPPELEKKCGEITDEMYGRVDKTMSLSEYQKWKAYLESMRRKVENAEIPAEDLDAFINYSKTLDLSRSHPVEEIPKKKLQETGERVVKPFVPERVFRKDIEQPKKPQEDTEAERAKREGFFTSPTVQRQKNERGPIAHIIRGGEQRGGDTPPANTFLPFGESPAPQHDNRRKPAPQAGLGGIATAAPLQTPFRNADNSLNGAGSGASDAYQFPDFSQRSARENIARDSRNSAAREVSPSYNYPDFSAGGAAESEPYKPLNHAASKPSDGYDFPDFSDRAVTEQSSHKPLNNADSEQFRDYGFPDFTGGSSAADNTYDPLNEADIDDFPESKYPDFRDKSEDIPQESKRGTAPSIPKVIRKNAAAISAYGKMAGAAANPAPEFDRTTRPETEQPRSAPVPQLSADPDPFKDVGSIFDVLEQSESDMSGFTSSRIFDDMEPLAFGDEEPSAPAPAVTAPPEPDKPRAAVREPVEFAEDEPAPEWEEAPITAENAPKGIWTEERNLFPENQPDTDGQSELAMLKERKRARSNKTQRLFDAIMREPDDNPNFRRK